MVTIKTWLMGNFANPIELFDIAEGTGDHEFKNATLRIPTPRSGDIIISFNDDAVLLSRIPGVVQTQQDNDEFQHTGTRRCFRLRLQDSTFRPRWLTNEPDPHDDTQEPF